MVQLTGRDLASLLKSSYMRNKDADKRAGDRFTLDHTLSNGEHKVYMDGENGGAPVVSFTGTRKGSDLVTDAALLFGLGRFTPRFRHEERLVKKVKSQYGDKKLTLVGHSLGGSLASANAGRADKVVTLDKGVGLGGLFGRSHRNETSIRGAADIVSALSVTQRGKTRTLASFNPLTAHNVGHVKQIKRRL
jgi:pimeloyl-ACP methyl ester carboxylesterase